MEESSEDKEPLCETKEATMRSVVEVGHQDIVPKCDNSFEKIQLIEV